MTRPTEPGTRDPGQRAMQRLEWAFEWGLLLSRLLILIPVIVLVASAATSFVYDAFIFIRLFGDLIGDPFQAGHGVGRLLLIIDLFLVGATLLIAAIGFYELFISRVDVNGRHGMPRWLVMNDLNDLKARVVSMLVLVTAVSFVDFAVGSHGGRDVFFFGAAVALVIAALTAFLRFGAGGREGS
jgi:uncharacterized membrane protein YqhA